MENIFFGILATVGILGIVFAIIHFSSRKTTPPATGAVTSPAGSTDWGKEWEKWKEKIAIPLSAIAFGVVWYLNEPDSFSKATHSRMFWSGVFLVVVLWGYFLTLPKTFKENFSRKFFMLTALPVGLAMMLLSFMPVEKVKADVFNTADFPICSNAKERRFSSNQGQIQIAIQTDCWSGWIIMPKQYVRWEFNSPGDIEFLMINGKRILLKGDEARYGWRPTGRFRLRGLGPSATVKIEK